MLVGDNRQPVAPLLVDLVRVMGSDRIRAVIPVLRELRTRLEEAD